MYSIGIGSKTSTGGEVIEGNPEAVFNGLVASSVGQLATCKACTKGIGPIIAVGPRSILLPKGLAARAGDYVACGCPPGTNVLLPDSTVILGDQGNGAGAHAITTAPAAPQQPTIFAKSRTVPPTTTEAGHTQEPLINVGQVLVLAPLRSQQQGRN